MRATFYILLSICLLSPSTARALTWDRIVDTKYVREHSDHVSVTVVEEKQGMTAFTVGLTVKEPYRVVAHVKVRDGSRTVSETHTPIATTAGRRTFRFLMPRRFVGSSTCSVSVSLGWTPGGTHYLFRLSDFVSPKPSESADVAREFAEAAGESLSLESEP